VDFVTLGWGIGWAFGGAVAGDIGVTSDYRLILTVGYALWGAIGAAVGSWVTFWQLREARQSSP
jgi:hypothetical protein